MSQREDDVLKKLQDIVGQENVITDKNELEHYGKDNSFVKPFPPIFVARPASKEEVQEIVLMSNKTGFPLVPYTTGTTLQGAHIPSQPSITVDLSRMNKIQLIDPVSRNVIIEPGVTFAQLQEEAKKEGLRVLTPVGVPAHASVLTTYTEFTPLFSWSKYGPWEILTAEFVLPTGEIMSTGQMDVGISKYPYSWTTAHALTNRMYFGAQGTFGIVTNAAVTVKTDYESAEVFFAGFNDLNKLVDAARSFLRLDETEEVFVANPRYLSMMLGKTYPEDCTSIMEASSSWTLVMVVRGYKEEVAYKSLDMEDTARKEGVKLEKSLPGVPSAGDRVLDEIACPRGALNQNRYKGSWTPIFCHITKEDLVRFHGLITSIASSFDYPAEDIGFFIQPLNHGGNFYFEPGFYRNPDNSEESKSIEGLFMKAGSELISQGAFFDRPYPLWAEQVYARATTYHDKVRDIKKAIDPSNIMNPGKLALS